MSVDQHPQHEDRKFYAGQDRKVWLESELIRSWFVTDAEIFGDLLRTSDLELAGMAGLINHVEERTGKPLTHLRRATKYIPIMLDAEDHASLRRALALYLQKKAAVAAQVLPSFIDACLVPLRQPGKVDLHRQVVEPLMVKFTSLLVGKDIPKEFIDLELLMIFFWSKSPSTLIELNRQFGVAFEFLEPDCIDEMDLACKICCLTFGRETLGMMLIESILLALSNSDAATPALMPSFPSETGVPLTWRRATKDMTIRGCPIRTGDIVKLRLQTAAYAESASTRNVMFGAGPHSCVGKQISLVLWDHFSKPFNALKLHGRLLTYDANVEPHGTHYSKVEVEIL